MVAFPPLFQHDPATRTVRVIFAESTRAFTTGTMMIRRQIMDRIMDQSRHTILVCDASGLPASSTVLRARYLIPSCEVLTSLTRKALVPMTLKTSCEKYRVESIEEVLAAFDSLLDHQNEHGHDGFKERSYLGRVQECFNEITTHSVPRSTEVE